MHKYSLHNVVISSILCLGASSIAECIPVSVLLLYLILAAVLVLVGGEPTVLVKVERCVSPSVISRGKPIVFIKGEFIVLVRGEPTVLVRGEPTILSTPVMAIAPVDDDYTTYLGYNLYTYVFAFFTCFRMQHEVLYQHPVETIPR